MNYQLVHRSATARRRHTTATERVAWIQRFQRSQQTQQVFARRHGIGLSTLQSWLRRHPLPVPEPRLVELPIAVEPTGPPGWEAELVLGPAPTLRLRGVLAQELVAHVLKGVQ